MVIFNMLEVSAYNLHAWGRNLVSKSIYGKDYYFEKDLYCVVLASLIIKFRQVHEVLLKWMNKLRFAATGFYFRINRAIQTYHALLTFFEIIFVSV